MFFRAQTFAGALRLLEGMVVPIRSGGAHLVSRHDALLPIAAAMAIFWLLPNVQELHGNLDTDRGEHPAPSLAPLRWSPSLKWGVVIGVLGLVSVAEIARRQSEFLYYQF